MSNLKLSSMVSKKYITQGIFRIKVPETKSKFGNFYFTLQAPNSRQIGKSEGYETLDGACKGIDSVIENAITRDNFELFYTGGQWGKTKYFYWNLKAANGEIILTSQMYKAKQKAQVGMDAVIKWTKKYKIIKPT